MATLGVVLGGGGVLCAAELGVLEALGDWGIVPEVVVGTSGGGIIAGALAAGVPLDALTATLRIVSARPERYGLAELGHAVRDLAQPTAAPGLFTLRPVLEDLLLHARAQEVSRWAPHYGVTTTSLGTGELLRLTSDSVTAESGLSSLDALQATSAFPGLFSGVRIAGALCQDGGLLDNVPGDFAASLGADRLLSISFDAAPGPVPATLSLLDCLYRSITVAVRAAQRPEPPLPAISLSVPLPHGAWLLSFGLFEQLRLAGYGAATARRQEIAQFAAGGAAA
jgi:NTE family protein